MKKLMRNVVTGELIETDVDPNAKVPAPARKANPYREGVRAYQKGVQRGVNPYGSHSLTSTRQRKQWFQGWDYCFNAGHTFGGDK